MNQAESKKALSAYDFALWSIYKFSHLPFSGVINWRQKMKVKSFLEQLKWNRNSVTPKYVERLDLKGFGPYLAVSPHNAGSISYRRFYSTP
jgi:hypothetical protein